ncbi:TlpA disulfide reductase family protein [Ekhidna sp.]|uniref:TlpA family protein disulfide reductase n=1 Tax=Ekhidna sp. TaxID=2608089 RepID=UPI0032EBBFCA
MKFLSVLVLSFFFISANGKTTIVRGSINLKGLEIQLMGFENPYSDNIYLLDSDIVTNDGKFEFSFESEIEAKILILINDQSQELFISPGSILDISLEYKKFDKPDDLGRSGQLNLIGITSDNNLEAQVYSIRNELELIKNRNRNRNGRLSKKYGGELSDYLVKQLQNENQDHIVSLSNSIDFANALSYLKRNKSSSSELLINAFIQNFQPCLTGIKSVSILYTINLQLDFFRNKINKIDYFDFINQSVPNVTSNEIIQEALKLDLITTGFERKWTDQKKADKALSEFIESANSEILKRYAIEFKNLQINSIIGEEVKNFTFSTTDSSKIDLNSFRGSYLLIDFWATWCGPCIKSMKKLPSLKSQLNTELKILCVTEENDVDKIKRFISKHNFNDVLDFAISDQDDEISSYFNKRAIPLYFLIDPNGVIIDKAVTDPEPMILKHLDHQAND